MGRIRVDLTGIISGNESYYVKVDEGFVIDGVTSTPNQAITNTTDIAFTTDPAPLLSTSYPADNDTSYTFAQPALVTITFPQAVTINTGNIYIKNGATTVETLDVTNGWMETTTELRIEGSATLDSEIAYTVDYQAGIVKDANGFSVPAGTDDGTVTVTANPLTNASKVTLQYPETITLNTGTIVIRKDSDDSLIESFTVPGDVTLIGGNTIEITPTDPWFDDTIDYYVTSDAGVVLDSNNFESPAITKGNYGLVTPTWTYSGFTGVVRLDFDQDVEAGTGYIYIKRSSDDSIIETYDVASDVTFYRNTAYMTAKLYPGQSYYVNVDATAIQNGIEEPYAGISSTTGLNFNLYNGPSVISTVPIDDSTSIENLYTTGIQLTFDVPLVKNTGNITLKKTSDDSTVETFTIASSTLSNYNQTVTVVPSTTLETGVSYYVLIDADAFYDVQGLGSNAITSKTDFNFTVGVGPELSSSTPADNATGIVSMDVSLVFDEPIDALTGNITLKKTSDDSTVETFDVTTDITGNGTSTIGFTITEVLDELTSYYILVDANAFKGQESGINYAGISSTTALDFTTGSGQTISSLSPLDNEAAAWSQPNFIITFTGNVYADTGNFYLRKVSDDSIIQQWDVTSDITITTNTVYLPSDGSIAADTSYYIDCDTTAIYDDNNIHFAGITDKVTWNFTTESAAGNISWYTVDSSLSGLTTGHNGISFDSAGSKMYLTRWTGSFGYIETFNLSTAWDITTAPTTPSSTWGTSGVGYRDIHFSSDGTKMFCSYSSYIEEFTLGTAWNVSTASSVDTFNPTEAGSIFHFSFSVDGTKLYVLDSTADIYQYSLSTAWDLSTASYDSKSYSPSVDYVGSINFASDGGDLYCFVSVGADYLIHQYSLSTAWDISTASFKESLTVSFNGYTQDMYINSSDELFRSEGNLVRKYT